MQVEVSSLIVRCIVYNPAKERAGDFWEAIVISNSYSIHITNECDERKTATRNWDARSSKGSNIMNKDP